MKDQYKEVDERFDELFGVGGAYNNENLWEVDKNIKAFWHSELEKVRQETRKECIEAVNQSVFWGANGLALEDRRKVMGVIRGDMKDQAIAQATQNINNLEKE